METAPDPTLGLRDGHYRVTPSETAALLADHTVTRDPHDALTAMWPGNLKALHYAKSRHWWNDKRRHGDNSRWNYRPDRVPESVGGHMGLDDDRDVGEDSEAAPTSDNAGQAALRGGVLRVGGYFAGILVSTLSSAMLFRHLGVITSGKYVTALSLVAIVASVSDLGLTAVGIREMSTLPASERWALASDLLGLKLTLTFVGGIIVTGIAWAAYSPTLATGVALSVVGLAFNATQDNFALALLVDLRLGWVAILDLMRNMLSASLIISLVLLGAHLVPFLAVPIPVCLAVTIATAMLVHSGRSLAPSFRPRRWLRFASSVLAYSAAVAAAALYYRVSILLVSALSTSRQLGYFSVSYRVIDVLTVIPTLLVSSAFPVLARAAQDDRARFAYGVRKVFEIAVIAGAWTSVSIAVGAPLAIAIIGGPTFRPAVMVLAFQGIGLGAMFVNAIWAYGLLSLGLYRVILGINTFALALNALIVAPMVINWGARGAAIGTDVTEVVVTVLQGWAYARSGHVIRSSLTVLPKIAVAAGLALTPLALSGLPVLVKLAASSVIFVVVALGTCAVPQEVRDLFVLDRLRFRGR